MIKEKFNPYTFHRPIIVIKKKKKRKNQIEIRNKSFFFYRTKIKNQLEFEQGQQGDKGKRIALGLLIVTCGM